MEGLLKLCSDEKCFTRLAEVVKLARDKTVVLDHTFYQQVLVALQQWGQDQEALAEVSAKIHVDNPGMKRKVERLGPRKPVVLKRGNSRLVYLVAKGSLIWTNAVLGKC
jgi:hypothetical protein